MNPLKHAQGLSTTIARVILGIIFLAHGCQKLFVNGMDATSAGFQMMDVPAPTLSAWVAAILEFAGGIALIAGLAVPLVALLLILDMIGAIFIAHIDAGFWASDGGYELPLALIAGLIAVAIADQGLASVDSHVAKRFKK
ncbi:DoxX family protein [Gordonia sp. (in: high G+C Gram-positive bacteria)]|uniref:DoxX family protein n=1 Tax=Gordonia sp. (in: high G+C Gram-positive bacteria) TaxID=84139 RepID=UPI003F99218F